MSTLSKQELLSAASSGQIDQLKTYLSSSLPNRSDGTTLEDLLAEAARSDQAATVSILLQYGAKVTHITQEAAHQGGGREVYRLLIPHGLDVNYGFGHAGGPLTEAVLADDIEWVKMLLDNGANPELAPLYGNQAALAVAAANSVDSKIVELLLEHGARTDYKGLLALAVKAGNVPFVKFILNQGASVNERVEESFFLLEEKGSMLQLAARLGYVDVIEVLLQNGADISSKEDKESIALIQTLEQERDDDVKLLESKEKKL